jgi:adenine-specific DNA-methyltransferase
MATRAARVDHGAIFTRRWIADLMLDLAGYTTDADLLAERVVEPSVGDGAFLGPLVERLIAARGDEPWSALADCLRGWDLQPHNVEISRKVAMGLLTDAGCPTATAETLTATWLHAGDFLLTDRGSYRATLVIGNPPYIRIEDLPAALLADYRQACPTMAGRSDIFVGFYQHGLEMLEPEGRLVYICADRWMRNAYGKALRSIVVDNYSVDTVIVLHDVDAFEAEVSAYPAITVLRRGEQGEAVTVDTTAAFDEHAAAELMAWTRSGERAAVTSAFDAAKLHSWHTSDDIWPTGSAETLAWLENLNERLEPLERADGLTTIRIGVATGNDKVYCVSGDNIPDIEPDRLLPMVCSEDIKTGEFLWTGTHLVDPWRLDSEVSGRESALIDLELYPKTATYFEAHVGALRERSIAKRGRWYQTIDRVFHSRTNRGFLVMEDMKDRAHPVFVPPGFYPHHNLYAVMSEAWDLQVLGGLLMSEVFERQIVAYCVKMRGGTLRFQSQYIRKCRFPAPETIQPDAAIKLVDAFKRRDRQAATDAALLAYGLTALPA